MWTFTFYRDEAGEYRWRLKGANGEIVGHGEGHTRLADAERAAERFKAKVGQARILKPKSARPRRVARSPQRASLFGTLAAQSQQRHRTKPN